MQISNLSNNVRCFSGYRLLDVNNAPELFDAYIDVPIGETIPIHIEGKTNINDMSPSFEDDSIATITYCNITGGTINSI